ncbi:MAG: HAMP domain-containing sensor histidine kinase [Desulfosporosinus sp.]|nr:HAMP domain-containing sensor histidine kinase [Desulfosporosinus sp.]
MAIKLKNIKYSTGAKITAGILVWLFFMGTFVSSAFLLSNHQTLFSNNYYESNQFQTEFTTRVHNVIELNVKLKNEEKIKASGEAESVISDNLDRIHRIQDRLSKTVNFAYYIKNPLDNEIITNLTTGNPNALDLIQKQATAVHYNQWGADSKDSSLDDSIHEMLAGTPYEVYAAVIEPLKPGDIFYDDYVAYARIKSFSPYVYYALIISILLMGITFIYLAFVTGRREKEGEIVHSLVDRIYTDVYSLLVFIAALLSIAVASNIPLQDRIESIVGFSIILGIDVLIGLPYVLSMIRQLKSKQLLRNSLVYRMIKGLTLFVKLSMNGKVFKVWTLFLLLAYGAANLMIFMYGCSSNNAPRFFCLLLIFNIAALYFAAKSLWSLSQIIEAAKEISTGNLDYIMDQTKLSVAFSDFAQDIQNIQGGLKKAVAKALEGERMKIDLITNVSHDLKTPLTSIINYVDLLKRGDLNQEKVDDYVGILEEKSARLKQLIEDLVEASKASSGNLTIKAEKVDLHELILQACGEYEDKLRVAELDLRLSTSDEKTLVFADGKHMWRIVENLFSNVTKYSMPHSRVYINLTISDQFGLLTIKNISAFPLEISSEQLTERFVRGDVSRTTEGSGLGLSIAQSLTTLQGGRFKIENDGDLFKVLVEIPLWTEMPE